MRTVYLGTSDFAAGVLHRLARSEHRPALVVTRPDRPQGRGRKLASPPVAEAARELELEQYQPEAVNSDDALGRLAAAAPEVLCICAFGALIRERLLATYPIVGVHPSLLPRWRGAAPIERAIEAGDDATGVSIIRLTAELDAGPIGLQRGEPILRSDDFGSLSTRLRALAGELLVEALDTEPVYRAQPQAGVTFAPKIRPEERRLDPGRPADELERRVRALTPHIGAFVELPGRERLGVRRALAHPDARPPRHGGEAARPACGELVAAGGRLLLGCAKGTLELLEVRPAGGRAVAAADYLRGRGRALAHPV